MNYKILPSITSLYREEMSSYLLQEAFNWTISDKFYLKLLQYVILSLILKKVATHEKQLDKL